MPFEPGHKKSKGRPKGSKNKNTIQAEEIAERLGCNPLEILMHFAMGNWKGLGYDSSTTVRITKAGALEIEVISPEMRKDAAKEACQYLYPKRKAIEHSGFIEDKPPTWEDFVMEKEAEDGNKRTTQED